MVLTISGDARAIGDGAAFVEIGGVAGYMSPPIHGATTPFGAGFGGHLGLEIHGFYVGARAIYYLGGTDVDVSDHAVLYGAELGYSLLLGHVGRGSFTLRPQLGIGLAAIAHTDPTATDASIRNRFNGASVDMISSASSNTVTVNDIYLEPALTVMFSSGALFVALSPSLLAVPGIRYGGSDATTWISYGLQGQLGFRF